MQILCKKCAKLCQIVQKYDTKRKNLRFWFTKKKPRINTGIPSKIKNDHNGRGLFWQPQPDCKFPPRHIRHGGPLSARKVQTRYAYFYQLRARTVPVQIWGTDSKIKNDHNGRCLFWQPQPDSNWCSRLERAVSWASRRWGQNCHACGCIQPQNAGKL